MKDRVREIITASPAYDDIRAGLERLGFRAKITPPLPSGRTASTRSSCWPTWTVGQAG